MARQDNPLRTEVARLGTDGRVGLPFLAQHLHRTRIRTGGGVGVPKSQITGRQGILLMRLPC